jgi:hypothetical protein
MTTEILKEKTDRYLCGQSVAAETNEIQSWLSCTPDKKTEVSEEERSIIEDEIIAQVQAYAASSVFRPKAKSSWKKITVFF